MKENKGETLNELMELLRLTKWPNRPLVKFLVNTIHTMEELKLSWNRLKGSQSILTFSSDFDLQPHGQLLKEIMT